MSFLDFLFPIRSLTGEAGVWVTEAERRQLKSFPVIEEKMHLRKRGLTSLDRITAASSYRDSPLLKAAIHRFKYQRIPALRDVFVSLMMEEAPPIDSSMVLCPVPLYWTRKFLRGFNQAELLAYELSKRTGLPSLSLLRRRKPTGFQSHRKRDDRFAAVRDAFRVSTTPLPRHVVLIDDLSTTGATLDACARALKEKGVERVDGWVVAHG